MVCTLTLDRFGIRFGDNDRNMRAVPHTLQDMQVELRQMYIGTTAAVLPNEIESLLDKLR